MRRGENRREISKRWRDEVYLKRLPVAFDRISLSPHRPNIQPDTTLLMLSFQLTIATLAAAAAGRSLPVCAFNILSTHHYLTHHVSLSSTISVSNEIILPDIKDTPIDRRPHEQRVAAPRNARRLNHAFQHLYRHLDRRWDDNDWNADQWSNDVEFQQNAQFIIKDIVDANSTIAAVPVDRNAVLSAIHYLHFHGGYSLDEIQDMHQSFPPLFEIDVMRHLRPKMRFLKDCMGGGYNTTFKGITRQVLSPQLRDVIPASFFGARFERTIAPRHAFLVHAGIPHGQQLWESADGKTLFEDFLLMHRKPKQFAAMCNSWRNKYTQNKLSNNLPITAEQVVAFDKLFQRGMLSAARNDTAYVFPDDKNKQYSDDPSLMTTANVTSAQLIRYLIQHGANPYEEDVRGASLFHWAAGCGNLDALRELVECCNELNVYRAATNDCTNCRGIEAALLWKASRDHATPLHWAAAGAGPKEFGEHFAPYCITSSIQYVNVSYKHGVIYSS